MTDDETAKACAEHPVVKQMLERLRRELSPDLHYHSADHTEDVLREVLLFAATDGLTAREQLLLAIAAAYHDAGFLVRRDENELIAAQMARSAMEASGGFTPAECQQVYEMIEDTIVRVVPNGLAEIPRSKLAGYLLDADLSNFGRADFDQKRALIAAELKLAGRETTPQNTAKLLRAHRWHTPAARQLREAQKQKNLRAWEQETGILCS